MSEPFFRVEMLPAKHGDALLVEYGRTRTRRMLIDGGPLGAYAGLERRLAELPDGDQAVQLLVVTHVDTDHIEGIIRLLAMPEAKWPILVEQVWFNGWRHIEEARDLGGREGEMMSALIHYRLSDRWNTAFEGNAVRVGALPGDQVTLTDGMKLTILSPDAEALAALLKDWKAKLTGDWEIDPGDLAAAWDRLVEENKLHPGHDLTLGPEDLTVQLQKLLKGVDRSKANGSSIAFIAEFAGKSCMFLGDAHMGVVCSALEGLGYTSDNPLRIDAVKVSHHGSKNNITERFIELVDAKHWLISTNGDQHDHPDEAAIEAIIRGAISDPTLWFNYRSDFTSPWKDRPTGITRNYRAKYPEGDMEGIIVEL